MPGYLGDPGLPALPAVAKAPKPEDGFAAAGDHGPRNQS